MIDFAILTIFPMAMLVAASMDMLTMTIPNKISLALIVGFFLLAPVVGLGFLDILTHIGVAIALLALGMGMFAMGWIGGGDAKLFAATGLWVGYGISLFNYALFATLFGGALTLLILFYRNRPMFGGLLVFPWAVRLHDKKEGVPYGVALALAGLVVYPETVWMNFV